jgi:uncharacterized membrane protein
MTLSLGTYFRARLRLLVAILAGVICFFTVPPGLGYLQRLLISWDMLAWLYLFFMWFLMLRTDVRDIPRIARIQDESAGLVLGMVILGCLVSILAILIELTSLKHLSNPALHLLLTGATLTVSWALLPTSFAMHYAHHHYLHRVKHHADDLSGKARGTGLLGFSLYFSFTIAVASQTADVATGTTEMRKLHCFIRLSLLCSIWRFWGCR